MSGSVTNILTRIKRSTVLLAAVGLFFSAANIVGQSIDAPSTEVADVARHEDWHHASRT